MSGQGLTCLGHGTFTNSDQLCSCAALCFAAYHVNNMLRVRCEGLVRSAEFHQSVIYSLKEKHQLFFLNMFRLIYFPLDRCKHRDDLVCGVMNADH